MLNKAYLIIVGTAFASAVSQILLNYSNKKEHENKIFEYLNPYVILSYCILFVVLALNVYTMRFVGLKEAHAVAASTYAFVLILGKIFLKEKITKNKIIGVLSISIGILIFIS